MKRHVALITAVALLPIVLGIACRGGGESASESTVTSQDPVALDPEIELDPERQKLIWDLEHATFVMENYLGKSIAEALRQHDAAAVRGWFADELQADVFSDPEGRSRGVAGVTERERDAERGLVSVDRDAFLAFLDASIATVSEVAGSRVRVLSIDQQGEFWDSRMLFNVRGTGPTGGPAEYAANLEVRMRFTEVDQLKQEGPVVIGARMTSDVLRSSERTLMSEATESTGLAALPLLDNWTMETAQRRFRRYQPAVEDFDRDGFLDIALASPDGNHLLLRSDRGLHFENVTAGAGIKPSDDETIRHAINSTAAWFDYDNDGYPDLILGHRLYHNDGGARFVDVTLESGLRWNRVPLGVTVADFDNDGSLDLYVSYQKGFEERGPGAKPWVADTEAGVENQLWFNRGEGRFRLADPAGGSGGGRHQTFASSAFFYDDDALPDLYLANDFGRNVLLRNLGEGRFEDVTDRSGAGDYATSMGVTTGDLDNDGNVEIYVANMFSKMGRRIISHVRADDYPDGVHEQIVGSCAGNRLYSRRSPEAPYEEISVSAGVNEVGWAYAPAAVDLNGDGWLDLYASTGYMSFDRKQPDG